MVMPLLLSSALLYVMGASRVARTSHVTAVLCAGAPHPAERSWWRPGQSAHTLRIELPSSHYHS